MRISSKGVVPPLCQRKSQAMTNTIGSDSEMQRFDVAAVPSNEPGVYSFKTDLSMAGRWLLSIAAKVQGEAETVVGKITFRATR